MKIIEELASRIDAYERCSVAPFNSFKGAEIHKRVIDDIVDNFLPHGSGIDGTNEILFDECKRDKIVIAGSYHAMNDAGYYDGWYDFKIKVTPHFHGIDVDIVGNFGKYGFCKDSIADQFYYALNREIDTEITLKPGGEREVVIKANGD